MKVDERIITRMKADEEKKNQVRICPFSKQYFQRCLLYIPFWLIFKFLGFYIVMASILSVRATCWVENGFWKEFCGEKIWFLLRKLVFSRSKCKKPILICFGIFKGSKRSYYFVKYIEITSSTSLIDFKLMFHFYIPRENQKTRGILCFQGL